jgi:predicted ATPase
MKTRKLWPNSNLFKPVPKNIKNLGYWDYIHFELLEILNKNPNFTNAEFHWFLVDNGLSKNYYIVDVSKTWGFWFSSKR